MSEAMPSRRTSDEEKDLIEKAHRYLPAGSLGNFDANLLIREGRGGRVWDASGNEYAILLAEKIVEAVPCVEKVRFASSGSEATPCFESSACL